MNKSCGFKNCTGEITKEAPGAQIGFTIDGKMKNLLACSDCAYKILTFPRGSFSIGSDRTLRLN